MSRRTDGRKDDTRSRAARDRDVPRRLMEIYDLLRSSLGPQHWWPADTPFEVAVGAILTQNTNWKNVERAITNLRQADVLTVEGIDGLAETELAELIRPSGYFTVKARRLKNYIGRITGGYGGDFFASLAGSLAEKRAELLGISGIGPETADSILLYAGGHATFVVDAYTRRIMSRHGLAPEGTGYDELRSLFMDNLPADPALFNEYHALLVAVGKDYCRPKEPRCEGCPLRDTARPDSQ
jgi:endonuclease-3 related protein